MMKQAISLSFVVVMLLLPVSVSSQYNWRRLQNLAGEWKFRTGDDIQWSQPSWNDKEWATVRVPSPWEDEGYPGYDGFAWYRLRFVPSELLRNRVVFLNLGYLDDAGEIYLNGKLIGYTGILPPDFYPGDGIFQSYYIPQDWLNFGKENLIAVRVYDNRIAGGITKGDVGFFEPRNYVQPDYDFSGWWKFHIGDDRDWAEPDYDDSQWKTLRVPGHWDTQGFRNYDGFGWYRFTFRIPEDLRDERLTLLLGKIDDFDEVYLNGDRIGKSGKSDPEWLTLRAYRIPPRALNADGDNVLAVRVQDVWLHGGIYQGPIGLIRTSQYRPSNELKSWFERLLEWLEQ